MDSDGARHHHHASPTSSPTWVHTTGPRGKMGARRRRVRAMIEPPGTTASEPGAAFGVRLRRARDMAGLTQEELAERAGLTPNAISALERGEHRHPYAATVRA